MLDPRRLQVLREFAAQGTIALAADALGYTPSAVSQQLAQLQRDAGTELLRRSGRRLELTDAGHALVEHAGELLGHIERIEADLAAHEGAVRGTVRVAAFQTAAAHLVVPCLAPLGRDHRQLRVELVETEAEAALPALVRGDVDVVVADEYEHAPRPHLPGCSRVELRDDDMLVALPRRHPAARSETVRLSSLAELEWTTVGAGTAYGEMFTGMCRSAGGFEPIIRHRASDLQVLLDLVASTGVGAIVPAIGRPERDRRVAVRRLAEGSFSRRIYLSMRDSDAKRPAIQAIVETLAAA